MAGRREPLGKRALNILSVLAEARGEIVTKDEEAARFAQNHFPSGADDLRSFDAAESSLLIMSRADLRKWVEQMAAMPG